MSKHVDFSTNYSQEIINLWEAFKSAEQLRNLNPDIADYNLTSQIDDVLQAAIYKIREVTVSSANKFIDYYESTDFEKNTV